MKLEFKWYQDGLTDMNGIKQVSSIGSRNTLPKVMPLSLCSVPINKEVQFQLV